MRRQAGSHDLHLGVAAARGNRHVARRIVAPIRPAAWLVALLAAAWAHRRHGAPLLAVCLLAVAGILMAIAHIRPFGPLACLSFLIAAALIESRQAHTS